MGKLGIGQRIRQIRNGITVEKFSKMLGIHKSTLIRWEKEDSFPDARAILELYNSHNVSPLWLLTGEPEKAETDWALLKKIHTKTHKTADKLNINIPSATLFEVCLAIYQFFEAQQNVTDKLLKEKINQYLNLATGGVGKDNEE